MQVSEIGSKKPTGGRSVSDTAGQQHGRGDGLNAEGNGQCVGGGNCGGDQPARGHSISREVAADGRVVAGAGLGGEQLNLIQ